MIEKVAYRGWPNCYRLTDGEVELIMTADVGPRVMRYGFVDGPNLFYECEAQLGNTGEPWWMIRGGHRFWVAPETVPETYALDNKPLAVSFPDDDSISLLGQTEPETKLQKEMTVKLLPSGRVRVTHRLENCGGHAVKWAIWPATLFATGGVAFAAFPECRPHETCLQPTHPLVMWAYTDFSDPRWTFTKKYLVLRQDPDAAAGQKAGLFNPHTFGAYLLNGTLFAKRARAFPEADYTDFGCSFQIFTNRDFMELETLGPFTELAPGGSASHSEEWSIHRNIEITEWTDSALDRVRSLIS